MTEPHPVDRWIDLGVLGSRPPQPQHERRFSGPAGQEIHLRILGAGPPIVMLHMSPLTSAHLLPLAAELAGRHTCVLVDTPGYGHSAAMESDPEIDDYAARILAGLAEWDLKDVALYGSHTGAKIALAMAHQQPERLSRLVLDGLRLTDDAQRRARMSGYIPRLPPAPDGSHLLESWERVWRTSADWKYYADTPQRCREVSWLLRPELTARPWYGESYRAAFRCDPADMLATVGKPVMLLTRSTDELGKRTPRPRHPHVTHREADDTAGEDRVAAAITDFLTDGAAGRLTRPAARPAGRLVVPTAVGGLAVHRRGSGSSVRVHTPLGRPENADIEIDLPGYRGSEWESSAGWSAQLMLAVLAECLAEIGIPYREKPMIEATSCTLDAPLWFALETNRPRADGVHLQRVWVALRDSMPDPGDLPAVNETFVNLLTMSVDPVSICSPVVLATEPSGGNA